MKNKTEFRIIANNIRKELDMQNISQKLCDKIKMLDKYIKSKNVLLFYPLKYEVNVLKLMNDNKNFYLPRIKDSSLEICPYKISDELKESNFKTLEPLTKAVSADNIDLIVLPALAADINNNRLGYGKGFYDRLLATTNTVTVLPLPKELVFEKIPSEPHDKPVDILITC